MLRYLLSKLSPPKTPAERLALAFAVSEQDAKFVLDRLDDDERRAELLLLYAAKWDGGVYGTIDDFGDGSPARLAESLAIWEGTIEGQIAVNAWRASALAGPFRLRLAVRLMRDASRWMMRDFEKNFATARAAIRREAGR